MRTLSDILSFIGGCLVYRRNVIIHVGDTNSISGDTMIHVGEQIDKSL